MSLREVETLFRHLEIYQHISNNGFYNGEYVAYRSIKFLAVFLFCFRTKIATNIEFDQVSIPNIADVLGLTEIPRIDARRPTVSEAILVLLSRDSAIDSKRFSEHLDDKKSWDQFLNQGFTDSMDIDECSNLMKDVIKDIALSGN